jgi:hypothetical protein
MGKKILVLSLLLIFSANLYAVDGYKGLKFGMTLKAALQTKICSLREYKDVDMYGFITDVKRYKAFICKDLVFAQRRIELNAYFIDGLLHRVLISPSYSYPFHKILLEDLKRKYGFEEFNEVEEETNTSYTFQDKTVWAIIYGPPVNHMHIRYTSPQYERLLVEDPKKGKLRDDI